MDSIHNDTKSGRDAPVQLPLIAPLGLTEAVEPPLSRPARKHPDIVLLAHRNAIQALLQGPTPLAQLVTLEKATDGLALIDILRQSGLQLVVRRVPIFDANYDIIFCEVCALTAADVRRIHRVLKKAEGDHISPTPDTGEGQLACEQVKEQA